MFPYVLVLLSLVSGDPPDPIATFRSPAGCESLAGLLNRGFDKNNVDKRAVCVSMVKDGDI